MKISVVVPAYNAAAGLRGLLLSLTRSQLDLGDSLEVVVADDGSTDDTADVIATFAAGHDLELVHVFLPRTGTSGRAAARNAGIAKSTGELVLLVDADQVCAPGLAGEHVRYHRLRDDLVVAGPRHDLASGALDGYGDPSWRPEVSGVDGRAAVLAEFSENFNDLETCWHHMFSCNVSVRREHLVTAGGFDEGFTGWGLEDSELGNGCGRQVSRSRSTLPPSPTTRAGTSRRTCSRSGGAT